MKKIIIISVFLISTLANAQNFIIKNLDLNSKFSDFGAIYYQKNKVVFASPHDTPTVVKKTCEINKQPYLDLFIGEINASGQIVNKVKMSKGLSTKFHEAILCFTKDGNTVYFSANDNYKSIYKRKKYRSNYIQLFKATVSENGEWENIEKLPFNGKNFSTGHPALSGDERRLYFISDRSESIGKTDIFYVDVFNNSYGEPVNLGSTINTSEKEMFPFVSKDEILYFSSFGHNGFGGLDIFASKINEKKHSKPINLGAPINSNKDDFSFIISVNNSGYFSSNRIGGKGNDDIYGFDVKPNYIASLFNENNSLAVKN